MHVQRIRVTRILPGMETYTRRCVHHDNVRLSCVHDDTTYTPEVYPICVRVCNHIHCGRLFYLHVYIYYV